MMEQFLAERAARKAAQRTGSSGFIGPFAALAEAEPDRVFARFEGAPVTFGWLHAASDAVAGRLRARGLRAGDRVAVMLPNAPATIAVLFGLAKAGVVWVPVNVAHRGDGLRYILEHCEPGLAFVDPTLLPVVQTSGAALPAVETDLSCWLEGSEFEGALPEPGDLFAIMYTSGTTGRPKGVLVTHRMLCLAGEAAALVSTARDGDVFFVWEPLFHIGGAQLLVVPMLRRVVLAMVGRFSAGKFWEQVRAERAFAHPLSWRDPADPAEAAARAAGPVARGADRLGRRLPGGDLARVRGAVRGADPGMLRDDRGFEHDDVQRWRPGRVGRQADAVVRGGSAG